MADPVSWLVVEHGWSVVGPDGEELGRVDEVVADTGTDIFNGLTVRHGPFGRKRYVPSELVTEITEGLVKVSASDLDELESPDD
jgi:sporulation protein YlmC with PRC-barrel domain